MKADNKSGLPPVENELWLPPLARKTEEEIARQRKNRGKTKEALELSRKVFLESSFKGKLLWNWLPLILAIIGIPVIIGSILIGLSLFTTQVFQEQQVLAQQQIASQKLLEQQQIASQKLLMQQKQQFLAKQLTKNLTPLATQVGRVVDQQHDQALTSYLDYISALLLSKSAPLLQSKAGSIERTLARTRTLAILADLSTDALRRSIIIRFLHDTGLILANPKAGPVIQLANIDLSGINLKRADLVAVNFDGAILSGADLDNTILTSSSFRGAILTKANFRQANLENADFSGANLENTDFTGAALKGINLSGADTKNAKQIRN